MDADKEERTEADELAILQWYYGAASECTCQRCRRARRDAARERERRAQS